MVVEAGEGRSLASLGRLVSRGQTLDGKVRVWGNAITAVVALECYSYITACIGNHTIKAIAVG